MLVDAIYEGVKMGANKYRVGQEHNGKIRYFGHFPAKNAEEAIRKAYARNKKYYSNEFCLDKDFLVKRGFVEEKVKIERL